MGGEIVPESNEAALRAVMDSTFTRESLTEGIIQSLVELADDIEDLIQRKDAEIDRRLRQGEAAGASDEDTMAFLADEGSKLEYTCTMWRALVLIHAIQIVEGELLKICKHLESRQAQDGGIRKLQLKDLKGADGFIKYNRYMELSGLYCSSTGDWGQMKCLVRLRNVLIHNGEELQALSSEKLDQLKADCSKIAGASLIGLGQSPDRIRLERAFSEKLIPSVRHFFLNCIYRASDD